MIKLLIFDFDDTLINTEVLDYQSFKNTSSFFKSYIPTRKEIRKLRKKGFLASEIIRKIYKKSKQNFNEQEFIKFRKEFLESDASIKYLKFQPYAKNSLKKLYSYDIPIVICSLRKHKSIIKKFLRANNVHLYIDFILNDEKGNLDTRNPKIGLMVKTKMLKKTMKKYRLKSYEVISIGNSISDYRAAKKCGIKHNNLIFSNHNIQKSTFEHQFSSFKEIFDILNTTTGNNIRKK